MKCKLLLFFTLINLSYYIAHAQETPQPVYNFHSNYSTGLMFHVSATSNGYLVEFTSTKWTITDTYFDLFKEAIEGNKKVDLLFDFEPPLNEQGEYELTVKNSNDLETTNQGFSIFIETSQNWAWKNYDFNKLMLYIRDE